MNQAEKYLQGQIDQYKTPCISYHIFDKYKTIYHFESGLANIGKQRKVNDKTTFKAFSVTKTFTALAVIQLAELKKLDIEHCAKNYLPDFLILQA